MSKATKAKPSISLVQAETEDQFAEACLRAGIPIIRDDDDVEVMPGMKVMRLKEFASKLHIDLPKQGPDVVFWSSHRVVVDRETWVKHAGDAELPDGIDTYPLPEGMDFVRVTGHADMDGDYVGDAKVIAEIRRQVEIAFMATMHLEQLLRA